MDTTLVDSQTVAIAAELKSNDIVTFKNATLAVTDGIALTGGKNGTVTGTTVQNFLTKLEGYSFNAMTTCDYESDLVIEWTKRMRDWQQRQCC